MKKTRQDNHVIDYTGVLYAKAKVEYRMTFECWETIGTKNKIRLNLRWQPNDENQKNKRISLDKKLDGFQMMRNQMNKD